MSDLDYHCQKEIDPKLTSDNRSYIDDYKTHHLVYKNPAFDLRAMPIHGYLGLV